MQRLIYTSSATHEISAGELEQILTVSRRNNLRDGIGGLLLYHDGSFLQVLEGPESAVRACYQRIASDPRHQRPIKMIDEITAAPVFGRWSMGFQPLGGLSPAQQRQVINIHTLARDLQQYPNALGAKTGSILMAFLSSFREFDMVR